jgi:integrase
MTEIVLAATGALTALELARDYASRAMAPNTVRAYRAGWTDFQAFTARMGWDCLPAEPAHVGAYIASLATTHAMATIDLRLAAIAQMHRLAGHEWNSKHSAITQTLRAVRREHGKPQKQAAAIDTALVAELVASCDDSAIGVRDRAMLLLGFAGAMRRSEVVGLQIPDVKVTKAGIRLTIGRAKTDQEGRGAVIGIPHGQHEDTCPVRALARWMAMLGLREGPLFRRLSKGGNLVGYAAMQPQNVALVLQRRAELAGIEIALSPHGLRSGFITVAYRQGVRDDDIMKHTRHRDIGSMRRYIRRVDVEVESPAGQLGL